MTIGTIAGDKKIYLTTGSKILSKNMVESIRTARSEAGFPKPSVIMASDQNDRDKSIISKSMSTFLESEESEIQNIKYFVHVFCGKSVVEKSDSFYDSGSGFTTSKSEKEGMLMFHLMDPSELELKSNAFWSTGYYVLNDGYIYCYHDGKKSKLNFFSQLYNNKCNGCRRFYSESCDRPYLIELRVIIDHQLQSLCLATSSEAETNEWMASILNSLHVTSPEAVGRFDPNNCCEKFCLLCQTDEHLFLLTRDVKSPEYIVMDQKNISDVTAIYTSGENEKSSFCYIIVEFETILSPDSFEWSLFFVSKAERLKFLSSLTGCWERMFQVPLKTQLLDDRSELDNRPTSDDMTSDFGSAARLSLEKISLWHVKHAAGLTE